MAAIITLTTDFGLGDSYVGAMKGAILSACPHATLVDITHDIEPQDIEQAGFVLGRAWRTFPPGTVHLAVVDPGVGSTRTMVAARLEGHRFVGPDNGLLDAAIAPGSFEAVHAIDLSAHQHVSATFHGRDVMGPVAGRLAAGAMLDTIGPALLAQPSRTRVPAAPPFRCRVVHIDRFGNLLTGVAVTSDIAAARFTVAGRCVGGLKRTYSDVPTGELLALADSEGCLEIACRNGSAARLLGITRAQEVDVVIERPA